MGTESWRKAPRRVWGWAVYLEIAEPRESVALREAAQAVIAGDTPFDIARRWNARRDLPTVHGGPWSGIVVEKLLRRRTNTAGTDPLLSHEVHDAVLARLDSPERKQPRKKRGTGGPYRKIGLGKFVCTSMSNCQCGAPLRTSGRNRDGIDFLLCARQRASGPRDGQRHPTVVKADLEAAVVAASVQALAEQDGLTIEEAARAFAAKTLLDRRDLAGRYLDVVLHPSPPGKRGRGTFTITRRPA